MICVEGRESSLIHWLAPQVPAAAGFGVGAKRGSWDSIQVSPVGAGGPVEETPSLHPRFAAAEVEVRGQSRVRIQVLRQGHLTAWPRPLPRNTLGAVKFMGV